MPNEVMLAFSFSESNSPFPLGRSKIAQGGVESPLRIPVPRGTGSRSLTGRQRQSLSKILCSPGRSEQGGVRSLRIALIAILG